MLARVDAEDGLLTVKATTFKFLGNFWSPQKEARTLQLFVRGID